MKAFTRSALVMVLALFVSSFCLADGNNSKSCNKPGQGNQGSSSSNSNTNSNTNNNSSDSSSSSGSGSASGIGNNTGTQNTNVANGGAGGQGGQGGQGGSASASDNGNGNGNGNGSDNKTTSTSSASGGKVSNSGNSTNRLSNSQGQSQGQGQGQQQSSASDASGAGANSNNTTNNVEAAKIPVATAYAPTSIPTVPCFKGFGAGAQAPNLGLSLGGGKVDQGCDARETARTYMLMGARKAACKVMVFSKKNQKKPAAQQVTMDDCMYQEPVPVVAAAVSAPSTPAPVMPMVQVNPLSVQ
jgi:hypothetical protein